MNTLITKMSTSDFSSDLERGAAPRSIADDKSEVLILVIEIQRCEARNIFVHRYTYWELHPASGFKGVRFDSKTERWRSRYWCPRKRQQCQLPDSASRLFIDFRTLSLSCLADGPTAFKRRGSRNPESASPWISCERCQSGVSTRVEQYIM